MKRANRDKDKLAASRAKIRRDQIATVVLAEEDDEFVSVLSNDLGKAQHQMAIKK